MQELVSYIKSRLKAFKKKTVMRPVAGEDVAFLAVSDGFIPFPLSHSLPPVVFETKYCLSGIAGHYEIFEGLERPELEAFLVAVRGLAPNDEKARQDYEELLPEIWQKLKSINPALNNIKFNETSPEKLYDAIYGVSSQFNPDDIRAYLNKGGYKQTLDPAYKDLVERIEAQSGPLTWIPCYKTLTLIQRQLEQKPPERNSSPRSPSQIS